MADFQNEFSWSKSRNDIFSSCRRKYYYHYYGSWNGWKYNADQRTRTIYLLKKLQSRYMWIGSLVHNQIEKILKAYRANELVADYQTLEDELIHTMRGDFKRSREGWPARKPWRLYEHQYEQEVPDEQWRESAEQAKSCLKTFWDSELHQKIKLLESDQWLEIEDFSSFYLDGVKIHVVLDFSYRDGDQFYIFDWKTGQKDLGMAGLQLACYRIYATKQWLAEDEKIQTIEFNLAQNKEISHGCEEISLKEAEEEIRMSIKSMQSLLKNVESNEAEEEDFAYAEDESVCRSCSFRQVCRRFNVE